MKAALIRHSPIILSLLLVVLLNFEPNKFLIGWDNFLSEMNIPLSFKRSISSVWLEYAGLGLLDGMAHVSELPHLILKGLISLILPLSAVRQAYIFMMLCIGVFGAYHLIKNLVHFEKPSLNHSIPILGALFYLFNLATIQNFYVPFEPFAAHYAFLPWLLFSALYFLGHQNAKGLLFFSIVNLLAVPQAQVPTIFVVYLFSLSVFLMVLILETKRREIVLSSFKIILFTLLINAFWLLPFLYFVFTNSQVAFSAKINQMSTETVFLQNKEFGNLTDVMLLKGFWFNNVDPNEAGKFDYMLKSWREHLTPIVSSIGYLLFAIVLLGFIYVKRKRPFVLPFSALFLLAFTMLAVNTPPFSWIDSLLREIPLFGQAFRFPFTKFSILAALTYSFFFAIGVGKLMELAQKLNIKSYNLFLFVPVVLLLIFIFPVFKGNLFYEKERVNFPSEYNDLFNYFKSKPSTARIANFPQSSFWGWNYYRWGYGGAGFLWSAIPQPLLDRTFDVWSAKNENYYWEISYALYSKNAPLFEKVLQKYNVEYLILDKHIQSTYSQKSLFIPEFEELISRISSVQKDASFGKIDVYKTSKASSPIKFVEVIVNRYHFGDYDRAYSELGNYISAKDKDADIIYSFRSLFSGKTEKDKEFKVEVKENSLNFISGKNTLEVSKTETSFYIKSGTKNCDNFRKGKFLLKEKTNNIVELYSKDSTACVSQLVNISPSQGFLFSIDNKNIKGRPLRVWVSNEDESYILMDTYLSKNKDWTISYFVLPPQDEFSRTYSLHLDNISIADESINQLGKISFYPIPYDALTSLKFRQKESSLLQILDSNQAYDEGWKAYEIANSKSQIANSIRDFLPFLFGKELKSHVLLNNWANGWILDEKSYPTDNSKLIIIFLPQYLEYLGFLILVLFILYVAFKYRRLKN